MKRPSFLLRAVVTLLLCVLTTATAWADESGSYGTGVTYNYVSATHTMTISGTGPMEDKLSAPWYYSYKDEIETVVIESGVTYIAEGAFYKCSNLTSLTIPSTVTSIGGGAFSRCTSLTTVDIPASVTTLGNAAFSRCVALTDLTLREGLQTIDDMAFYFCDALASFTIPSTVTFIGEDAFALTAWYNNHADGLLCKGDWLINVKGDGTDPLSLPLPANTFTKIATGAFIYYIGDDDYAHDIVSLTIPAGVTTISEGAFYGCYADNVYCYADPATLTWTTANDDFMWRGMGKATKFHVADASAWSAKFPDANVTFVGDLSTALSGNCGATGHAEDVTWSYDLYSRTLTISGSGAMADYVMHTDGDKTSSTMYNSPIFSEIETITIESGVTKIGQDAFYNCTTLSTLNIPSTVTSINGFSKCTGLTAVTIPNTVETIDKYAFEGCTGLTTVTIGNGVTTIDEQAFDHTSSLTTLTIGSGVKTIKKGAFNYSGLTTLNIPDNVETLEFTSFGNCSNLQTVFIGSGLTSMNTWTFRNATGTSNLADMYCYADAAKLTMVSTRGKDVLTNVNFHVYDADAWRTKFYNDYFEANYVSDLDTYIFNAGNWNYLATAVANSGTTPYTTSGKTYKLATDITASTMIGTADHPFSGTFDGQDNTLTLDINTAEGAAPFRNISGATIQNLKVDGTLNAGNHSAALVGVVRGGTNVIENCVVSADITLSAYGGGIVAHGTSATTTLQGCVFDGTITGGTEVGTLWGWSDAAKVTITDCLDLSATTHPIGRCRTDAGYSISVGNTYYTNPEKSTSGEYPWTGANGGTRAGAYNTKPDAIGAAGTDYGYVTAYASGLGYDGKYYLAPLVISLADNTDNTTTISNANGYAADVTLSNRTLYKDGAWNTLCLPFNVTLAGSPLDGADARPLTSASIEGTTLNLTFGDAVSTLIAGTPYIIKWTADANNIENLVFSSVTIDATDHSYDNGESGDAQVRFIGTYKSTTFNDTDYSILFLGPENKLYYPESGASIGAQRAYFKLGDGSAQARLTGFNIDFGEEGETTGIISVNGSGLTVNGSDAWYTLNGVKLSGKPTKAGLYIHGNRKVSIK